MEIKGRLHRINETNQITDSFKKREFVLKVIENPEYPEYIKLEFIQDKVSELDSYNPSQEVSVQFNLKGREHTNKHGVVNCYNTLQAWRIEALNEATEKGTPFDESETMGAAITPHSELDDIPF